jgi:hypothetical protein
MRNVYKIVVRKPEGIRVLGRWVDKIKMDLKDTGHEYVNWIHLAQDREQWDPF